MFKPVLGPFVDLVDFGRLGRRRPIIMGAEVLMAISVLALTRVDPRASYDLFLVLVFIHNACGAAQDVATDGLAIQILKPRERGTGNGVMTAAKFVGVLAGGSALLRFTNGTDWRIAAYATAAMVLVPVVPLLVFREPARQVESRPRVRELLMSFVR
jgi:PAT family beta-lactamase induction signal transducer AmpG